ncbi:hypothetical protein Tco_0916802 [Tanacetum coccineum]
MVDCVHPLFFDQFNGVIGAIEIIIVRVREFCRFIDVEGDGLATDSKTQLPFIGAAHLHFFCFFNRDGKGMSNDLEGWYKVGDCGVPSPEFAVVSSPSGLSSLVVPWVADGVGADG